MNEARYLQAFGDASDRVMLMLGVDPDCITQGGSFFTAETHIRHLDEARAGQRIAVTTQMLRGDRRKMHLFHRMQAGGRLLAAGEHMLIHVSLDTPKASPPGPAVAERLARLAAAHAGLPRPEGAGAAVGGAGLTHGRGQPIPSSHRGIASAVTTASRIRPSKWRVMACTRSVSRNAM